jgi:hypothetical protein
MENNALPVRLRLQTSRVPDFHDRTAFQKRPLDDSMQPDRFLNSQGTKLWIKFAQERVYPQEAKQVKSYQSLGYTSNTRSPTPVDKP